MKRNLMWISLLVSGITLACFLAVLSGKLGPIPSARPMPRAFSVDSTQPLALYPKVSPFIGVRWKDDIPFVLTKDYFGEVELILLDDLTVDQMVSMWKTFDRAHWRERFNVDLVEVLRRNGCDPGFMVTMKVRTLDGKKEFTLPDVEIDESNRKFTLISEEASRQAQERISRKNAATVQQRMPRGSGQTSDANSQ